MGEPRLATYKIGPGGSVEPGEVVTASEAWRIGLSARDVRWLLGIPEPPRKPPTHKQLLRRCEREGCKWTAGIVDGWEFCAVHGTTRRQEASA